MLGRRKVLGAAFALVVGCNLVEGLDYFHPAEPDSTKPCVIDEDCAPFNGACVTYTCNQDVRQCRGHPLDSGADCLEGGGHGICDGKGSCVECLDNNISRCPAPKACTGYKCEANRCKAEHAPDGFDCSNGVCDGSGNCVQCTAAHLSQCASLAVDCLEVSCDAANRCVNGAPNPAGKSCTDPVAQLDGICDGKGKCVKCFTGNSSKCPPNDACTTYTCEKEACVANYAMQGLGCPNGVCDGKGLCKAACTSNGECDSNVCLNGICAPCTSNGQCAGGQYCNKQSGTCQPCTSQTGQCGADQYCDINAAKCSGKKKVGDNCGQGYECFTGNCSTSFLYCWVNKCCN
jgi:hypothetical protein